MHPRRVRHDVPAAPEAGLIVSIHAPAWGATTRGMFPIVSFGFQSTHPRGVRRIRPSDARLQLPVSIHAPAWGATKATSANSPRPFCFNPRTRVGCDPAALAASVWAPLFQSTHPRGVRRPARQCRRAGCRCFNPRTRVGCDMVAVAPSPSPKTSFNPRTRVGCDPGCRRGRARSKSFNPRTRVGCDEGL